MEIGIIHEILMIIIVCHGIVLIPSIVYTYRSFLESKFKELLFWIYSSYIISYFSYFMRVFGHWAMNGSYGFSNANIVLYKTFSIILFLIAMTFVGIALYKIYMFSEEYGFRSKETTAKLKEWIRRF